MNILVVLLISLVLLACGYLFYGRWLAKEWGVDPSRKTPSHELTDGMDYVPAKAQVLMGRLGAGAPLGRRRRHFLRRCA